MHDCKALDLLKAVVDRPLGANKRHLTLALEYAQIHNETELMLKNLPAYIQKHEIGKDLPDMAATDVTYGKHPGVVACLTFERVVAFGKASVKQAAKVDVASARQSNEST